MSHIVVNDEQAALIDGSNGMLEVRDGRGRLIGDLAPLPSATENAEAKARLAAGSQRPIVVDDEQAALISASDGALQVCNSQGAVIGYARPWPSPAEIAEFKARLAAGPQEPTYTTAQVLEYLRTLDEQ